STVLGGPGTTLPAPISVPLDPDNVPVIKIAAAEDGERYRFDAPAVAPAGTLALELENLGELPHDLVVLRPRVGVSTRQIEEVLAGPAPEAATTLVQPLGGAAPVAPKAKQTVAMRFEPGDYYLASFTRGADGRPGTLHGMYRRMEVVPAPDALARRA